MKNFLPGLKTKITAWIMALGPIAAQVGYAYDPIAVIDFIDQYSAWISTGYLMLGAAAHWFRNLANSP